MPISLKNLSKEIEKEFGKAATRDIEKLLTQQHSVYDAVVKSTLNGADLVLTSLPQETIAEMEASIQKFQIATPAKDTTRPNPKVSSMLGNIIQRNIKELDKKGDAIADTIMVEPGHRSMIRGG